jgi:ABC-2 type transport system ATP-binding protein
MDEAERCDHVALLDHGQVIALDEPQRLQQTLAGRIVGARTSDTRRALAALAGAPGIRRAVLFGDTIHVTATTRDPGWSAVRGVLASAGIDLLDLRDIDPSLEDVFMDRVAPS